MLYSIIGASLLVSLPDSGNEISSLSNLSKGGKIVIKSVLKLITSIACLVFSTDLFIKLQNTRHPSIFSNSFVVTNRKDLESA